MNRQSVADFQDSENTLYSIIMTDTCYYTFVQPVEYTPKVKCNVNWLWVIMMGQYRLISFNKCTTLVGNTDNGGGYECVDTRSIWEISTSLNFVMNLKLFQKE